MKKMPTQPKISLKGRPEPEFEIEGYKEGVWYPVVTVKGLENKETIVYNLGCLLGHDKVRFSRVSD